MSIILARADAGASPAGIAAREETRPAAGLQAEIVTTRDGLMRLAPFWNGLLTRSAADSVFLTWEWIFTWLEVMEWRPRILVVAVRDSQGVLRALAPFYESRMRLFGVIGFRSLRVLGDVDSGAEYPDLIVESGFESQALPIIARALESQRSAWDCIWLPNLAGWTGAADRLEALCGSGRWWSHRRPVEFAAFPLPDSYDAYFEFLSRNTRSNLRRSRNHLKEAAVEMIRCDRVEQAPEMLSALFALHAQRWASAHERSAFERAPRMTQFYQRFAPPALERGWLRLYGLRVDGEWAAVQYGYAYGGTFFQLQEGFDPTREAGIGNVLREHVIRDCIESGLRMYDSLGEFSEHKRRWGAVRRAGSDALVGRRGLKNRLLFTRPVWPTGRYLRSEQPAAEAGA